MTPALRHLHLDFETYCDLDLKKVGIQRYVDHPSFVVLCVAWQFDGDFTQAHMFNRPKVPATLAGIVEAPAVQVHAWNAAFESAVLRRLGFRTARSLSCTMQRALAYGLPARLDKAGEALKLATQKDKAGHRLMLKLSRPDKNGARVIPTPAEVLDLLSYCGRDVDSEAAVSDVIPPLPPQEEALSQIDARMNRQGIGVDLARVKILKQVAEAAEIEDAARCAQLTKGAVTSPGTQTGRLLQWLHNVGLVLPDVSRNTVEEALAAGPMPAAIANWTAIGEVLQIRLRTARASVRKLDAMLDIGGAKGVLCHQFQFCGAGRTGRWSGRGVQVQNLPRVKKGFSPTQFVAMAMAQGSRLNEIAPAPILDCISWSLRSCLIAPGGRYMWGFDFSQIEARVLAWLAGQQDVLDVFRSGTDVYVWAAAQFGSTDRQLGKVLILALGFGMGASKLQETARKQYGVTLSGWQAERFKNDWRARNSYIVDFWGNMQQAALSAIQHRGQVFPAGPKIAFRCTARTLQMQLPSGRVLYYHAPLIELGSGIVYWGTEVGGMWGKQYTYGGKLAENATQAVARDIMAEAMLRVYAAYSGVPLMTVHDELVYGVSGVGTGQGIDLLQAKCLEAPAWAAGLPISGESKLMSRYGEVLANTTP